MRFAVDESIRGELATEVTIETGSGGGDCGTPLPPSGRYLIFAYRGEKDGKLWTGACNGNRALTGSPSDEELLGKYRELVKSGKTSIFGTVTTTKPIWRGDEVEDSSLRPAQGMIIHAVSDNFSTATKTSPDGSYEFNALPSGNYNVTPEVSARFDFDHEYEDRYRADVLTASARTSRSNWSQPPDSGDT